MQSKLVLFKAHCRLNSSNEKFQNVRKQPFSQYSESVFLTSLSSLLCTLLWHCLTQNFEYCLNYKPLGLNSKTVDDLVALPWNLRFAASRHYMWVLARTSTHQTLLQWWKKSWLLFMILLWIVKWNSYTYYVSIKWLVWIGAGLHMFLCKGSLLGVTCVLESNSATNLSFT